MLIYRDRDQKPIQVAMLRKLPSGEFEFEYRKHVSVEFPGFPARKKKYTSPSLWEIFRFRIPEVTRREAKEDDWSILARTHGRLATDRFELQLA